MKNRIATVILVLVLLLSMAACSSTPTSQPTTQPTSQPTSQATTAGTTETSVAPTDSATPEVKKEVTLKYLAINWQDYSNEIPGAKQQADIIAEATGVRIDFDDMVKPDNPNGTINLHIAAGDKYDLIQSGGGMDFYRNLIDEGYIYNIKPDMDAGKLPNVVANYDPATWEFLTYKGGIYALTGEQPANTMNVLIRQDLLDQYSLAVPTTVDELINTISTIVSAEKNNLGLIMPSSALSDLFAASYIPNGSMDWLDDKGNVMPWYLHSGMKDYLQAMNTMYTSGVVPKDYSTMTYADWEQKQAAGSWVVTFITLGVNTDIYYNAVKVNVPNVKFTQLAPLSAKLKGAYPAYKTVSSLSFITKDCIDIPAAERYIDYVNSYEGYRVARYGVEGVHYKATEKVGDYVVFDDSFTSGLEGENGCVFGYRFGASNKVQEAQGKLYNLDFINGLRTMNLCKGVDYNIDYDQEKFASKDYVSDLQDLIDVETTKAIMGQTKWENWDNVVQKWYDMGGQTYIDDMTAQYNAAAK